MQGQWWSYEQCKSWGFQRRSQEHVQCYRTRNVPVRKFLWQRVPISQKIEKNLSLMELVLIPCAFNDEQNDITSMSEEGKLNERSSKFSFGSSRMSVYQRFLSFAAIILFNDSVSHKISNKVERRRQGLCTLWELSNVSRWTLLHDEKLPSKVPKWYRLQFGSQPRNPFKKVSEKFSLKF